MADLKFEFADGPSVLDEICGHYSRCMDVEEFRAAVEHDTLDRLDGEITAFEEEVAELERTIAALTAERDQLRDDLAMREMHVQAREALEKILTAGYNEDSTAQWMQKWAAHGLNPDRPRPDDTPPIKDADL